MDNRKEKILSVARELFGQYGLKSVTMDEIAFATGMSKKTIYQIFQDKKSLVKEVIDFEMNRIKQEIMAIYQQQNLNALERTIEIHKLIIRMYKSYPPQLERDLQRHYPDIIKEIHTNMMKEMFEAIVKNLKHGIREGYFRNDLKPEIIAGLQMVRAQFLRLRLNFSFIPDIPNEQIHKELLLYHLHGICSKKGLEYLRTINLN